ncbi:MAG: hypothetical protein IJU08_07180, partial [Bacteroidales bacterium]|nr:hypothetical protein [Bacteroidales bacterium]
LFSVTRSMNFHPSVLSTGRRSALSGLSSPPEGGATEKLAGRKGTRKMVCPDIFPIFVARKDFTGL